MAHHRAALLAAGMLTVLTACSGPGDGQRAQGPGPSATPVPVEADPSEKSVSALDDRFDPRLPEPLIDPDAVRSGGPPPDGIPPIDEPAFESADTVAWLTDDEPVLSLTVGGETGAYPLRS